MQFSQEEVSGVLERMMFGICFGCARSFAVLHKEGESREEAIARIRKVHGPEHLGCSMRYSQSKDMKTVAETVVRELRRTQLPEIFIDETLKGALDEDQFADHLGRYYKDWARLALYPLAVNCEGLTHPIFSGGQLVLLVKEMRGDDIGPYTIRASVCTIEDKRPWVSDVYVDWKRIKPGEDGIVPPQYHMKTSTSCPTPVCEAVLAQLPERYRTLLAQE